MVVRDGVCFLGGSPGIVVADQPRATLEKDADHKSPRAVAGEASAFASSRLCSTRHGMCSSHCRHLSARPRVGIP